MITDRQALILKAIVQQYIKNGEPVGSKALINILPIHVSSATVRNDMASLEKKGLIEKIHLSSGRIPSDKGYRYYLDNLLEPASISNKTSNLIKSDFSSRHFNRIDEIVDQSARILSGLTNYTAIASGPESDDTKLTGFRIVPLSDRQVMAIMVVSDGNVYNQIYNVSDSIAGEQIEAVVRVINDQLVGHTLNDVATKLKTDFPRLISKYLKTPDGFITMFDDIFSKVSADHFFVDGKSNLFNYVDANNGSTLKHLYSIFDNEDDLIQLLGLKDNENPKNGKQGISVHLGYEIDPKRLKNYSVITARYDVADHGQGLIALLGPTNMPYSQVIGLLGSLREELAKRLSDYFNDISDSS